MRDSFVMYCGYMDQIKLLSMEQRGLLLTCLIEYVSGKELTEMDGMTMMAFSFIKSQIDRDAKKYEEVCQKRSEAGKAGGRPKKANALSEKAKKANGFSEKQTKAKKADNEYEYDNDTEDNTYSCAFEKMWTAYPRKKEKKKASKCYKARLREGFSEDELFLAVKRYAEKCKAEGQDERYIKLCSTFLGPDTPFTDYLADDYRPPEKKPVKKNGFNNFSGRDYGDMKDLTIWLTE